MDYPCHKLSKDQWCDKRGTGGFMGHTCVPIQKNNDKDHRPQITPSQLKQAIDETIKKLMWRLNEDKGWGAWLSRHEISGFITEEYDEVKRAVHHKTLDDLKSELIDIAVGCIFATACINAKTLDW